MIVERQGACRYCGQVSVAKVPEEYEQEEVDAAVSRNCICDGAERENIISTACTNLNELAVQNAVALGYEYVLDEETVTGLKHMIEQIYDGVFREIRVVEPGGDTIRIWSKIRGVGVQRTHKVDRKL